MPRERVFDRDAKTYVDVGWTREREHVTVGVNNGEEFTSDTPQLAGYHAELTREEINRLIRVLRRARDQAFGRDE